MPSIVRPDLPASIATARPTNPTVLRERTGVSAPLAQLRLRGDTAPRLSLGVTATDAPALLAGAGGVATPDIRLVRSAAQTLALDGNGATGVTVLRVTGGGGGNSGQMRMNATGDANDSLTLFGGAGQALIGLARGDLNSADVLRLSTLGGPTGLGGAISFGTGVGALARSLRMQLADEKFMVIDDNTAGKGAVKIKVIGDIQATSRMSAARLDVSDLITQKGVPVADLAHTHPGGAGVTKGTVEVDFGPFPGASDASVAVTGQATIVAGSVVMAQLRPFATTDHTADEHLVETIEVRAGNIIAGTGFTIYAVNKSQVNEPVPFDYGPSGWGSSGYQGGAAYRDTAARPNPPTGGYAPRIYGKWSVGWVWA